MRLERKPCFYTPAMKINAFLKCRFNGTDNLLAEIKRAVLKVLFAIIQTLI